MTPDILESLIHRDFFAAKEGDRAAFARLVAATQRLVTSVTLAMTRDLRLSEDIAQDTYLSAWQRLGQMKNPESFLPWLRQVARHRAIDHLRRLRYRESAVDSESPLWAKVIDAGAGPEQSLIDDEDAALLNEALDQIPDECREVLLLFYREGQSSRDVAALLGLSDGAVRKRLQRARTSLREEVLRRVGETALRSAPGIGFTSAIAAAISIGPGAASASGLGLGAVLKTAPKWGWGIAGGLLASLGLILTAVAWEVRGYLRRARNASERRALLHNGLVYAALMGSYMVVLWWSAQANWTRGQTVGAAALFSVAIIVLAIERSRLLGRNKQLCRSRRST